MEKIDCSQTKQKEKTKSLTVKITSMYFAVIQSFISRVQLEWSNDFTRKTESWFSCLRLLLLSLCLDFMVESEESRNQDGFRWFIRALLVLKLAAKWTSFLSEYLRLDGDTIHRWIIVGQRPLKCSRWTWGWNQRDKQFCLRKKKMNWKRRSLNGFAHFKARLKPFIKNKH